MTKGPGVVSDLKLLQVSRCVVERMSECPNCGKTRCVIIDARRYYCFRMGRVMFFGDRKKNTTGDALIKLSRKFTTGGIQGRMFDFGKKYGDD